MSVSCFKHSRAHSALRRDGLGVINMNFAGKTLSRLGVMWAAETFLRFKHEWLSCSELGCSESRQNTHCVNSSAALLRILLKYQHTQVTLKPNAN